MRSARRSLCWAAEPETEAGLAERVALAGLTGLLTAAGLARAAAQPPGRAAGSALSGTGHARLRLGTARRWAWP